MKNRIDEMKKLFWVASVLYLCRWRYNFGANDFHLYLQLENW